MYKNEVCTHVGFVTSELTWNVLLELQQLVDKSVSDVNIFWFL